MVKSTWRQKNIYRNNFFFNGEVKILAVNKSMNKNCSITDNSHVWPDYVVRLGSTSAGESSSSLPTESKTIYLLNNRWEFEKLSESITVRSILVKNTRGFSSKIMRPQKCSNWYPQIFFLTTSFNQERTVKGDCITSGNVINISSVTVTVSLPLTTAVLSCC